MINIICCHCNNSFIGRTKKNRTKRYCSPECSNKSKIKIKKISKCITCSKEFPELTNQRKGKFCSHKCIRYTGNKLKLGLYKGTWPLLSYEEKLNAIKDQFNKNVIKKDGCWGWKKVPLATGYTSVYTGKRKLSSGHRVSWLIHYGEIPSKMFVLHKCDNRICTNPEHLFLGTHIDNMKDMVSKNRQFKKRL
jgi:hypothetical protein